VSCVAFQWFCAHHRIPWCVYKPYIDISRLLKDYLQTLLSVVTHNHNCPLSRCAMQHAARTYVTLAEAKQAYCLSMIEVRFMLLTSLIDSSFI